MPSLNWWAGSFAFDGAGSLSVIVSYYKSIVSLISCFLCEVLQSDVTLVRFEFFLSFKRLADVCCVFYRVSFSSLSLLEVTGGSFVHDRIVPCFQNLWDY